MVDTGMSESLEAEVGVALDDPSVVAGFKADGNADKSVGLGDLSCKPSGGTESWQEVRMESSLSAPWLRLTRRKSAQRGLFC